MARKISVSRAARLVGVKRGTLQQQIRSGQLSTFEGQIVLSDLLQAYPDAEIEDSSMLERVEQIIERARFLAPESQTTTLDNAALASRIRSLSHESYREKQIIRQYQHLIGELRQQINQIDSATDRQNLLQWLETACTRLERPADDADIPFANETFLRTMTAQATVMPSGHEFFVEGVESILEAGLRGGLALNYGCSNGNCGLCKIRLVSGQSQKIKHHDHSLSEAERGMGYILSCCHTAVSDVVLEADEASGTSDIPTQTIPLRIKKIEHPNEQMMIVSAKTPRTRRLRFLAGQQARLSIDHIGSATYPIASCPCDDMNLQFHIPLDAADTVAQYIHDSVVNNDLVTLDGPSGAFVLDENSPNSLIFIAEGPGFATVKGLIEHAMALDSAAQICLLWIAPDQTGLYLHNLCRAWNDALDNFSYHAMAGPAAEQIETVVRAQMDGIDPASYDFYVCAQPELNERLTQLIEELGVARNQYHFEAI